MKNESGSVCLQLNVSDRLTTKLETYATISGQFANGFAPVLNILTACTLHGDENLIAAKFEGPRGFKLHQCNNVGENAFMFVHICF